MCGIAGVMTTNGKAPGRGTLDRMAAAMRHRGPDGGGRHTDGGLAMVQTRLAIIDLATGGHPLYEGGGAALIGNGEIYNYRELRKDPLLKEARFSTQSDFEPALHLYRALGMDFTRHLRGMYAIAIHDKAADKLVLARDPFGIKPLYYIETPGLFAFASEAQVLAGAGLTQAPEDRDAYLELLQLQFVTGRKTAHPRIERLLPGERIVVKDGRIVERLRDAALPAGGPDEAMSQGEALERLDAALAESVELHQRADVPYGLFLSGGIDSSALLAMMARLNSRPVRTFTIGFRSEEVADERKLAGKLAAELGTDHVEVDFGESDLWALLPKVAGALDDPTADYATLPTYKLAAAAHGAVKVVLAGEGGDEFFAGYGRYRRALRPWYWPGSRTVRHRSGTFGGRGVVTAPMPHWREAIAASEKRESTGGRDALQTAQAVDIADWLPHDLLNKLDRCLMAHSLEGRVPFVDPVLGAFGFRLPSRMKFKGKLGKHLLRQWLARQLPSAEPFSRKRGFTVPVNGWMSRQGEKLGPLVARQAGVRDLCDGGAVRRLFADGSKDTGMARWALLFFACWHQHHMRGVSGARDAFEHLDAA